MRDNYTGSLKEKLGWEHRGTGIVELAESTETLPTPFHIPPTLTPEQQDFKNRMDAKLTRDRNFLST